MTSKIIHERNTFSAMSEALSSLFGRFTGATSYEQKIKHAEIYINGQHYKAQGKMLDVGNVHSCFLLTLVDDRDTENALVLRCLSERFLKYHPQCENLLKREYELYHQLALHESPYQVSLVDSIESEKAVISKLIPGLPLNLFVNKNLLYLYEKPNTARLLRQLIEAVKFLHDKGMYHLDLDSNCLLIKDNLTHDLVLLNNGLAAAIYDGIPIGKCHFQKLPPELHNNCSDNSDIDCRTDIWEIGKLIEYIAQVRSLNAKHNNSRLTQIAAHCTMERKEDRYQSLDEILHDLAAWEQM